MAQVTKAPTIISESGSDTIGTHKALRSQNRQVWHDRHMFVNDMHRLRNA